MIERYALPEIKAIWEDENKYTIWKKIEILACEARAAKGEIPADDLAAIKEKAAFSVERINEIEAVTNHDVIAFLTNMAEHIGPASRHVHYGMTSSDILDTTLSIQMKESGELLRNSMLQLQTILKEKAVRYKYTYCIGRTHGVHAEPTTLGLKFALWYEENNRNLERLQAAINVISVGQISGAVGTYDHLPPDIEAYVCEKLGLSPAPVSTQVLQRDRHAEFLSVLAIIGSTLEKIATEIRHLQKTEVLEAEEPFKKGQKGSSAMPHKRNPIVCERVAGLARVLRGNAMAAMENNNLWHERDITHSSVERIIAPDSCQLLYYMLHLMKNVLQDLMVYPENMLENLNRTRGLVFSQKILLLLVEKGLTREEAYALVQRSAMQVWADKSLHLADLIAADDKVQTLLSKEEIQQAFDLNNSLQNIDYIFKRSVEK